MFDSVYKIVTLVGTSTESWDKTLKMLQDSRIAEVHELDMQISDGKIVTYCVKVRVSSKYHGEEEAERVAWAAQGVSRVENDLKIGQLEDL